MKQHDYIEGWLIDKSKDKPVGERYSFDEVIEILKAAANQDGRFTLKQALDIWEAGRKKGHWQGRLDILNLPGCNYSNGDYMTGALENDKKTPDEQQYFKQTFDLNI